MESSFFFSRFFVGSLRDARFRLRRDVDVFFFCLFKTQCRSFELSFQLIVLLVLRLLCGPPFSPRAFFLRSLVRELALKSDRFFWALEKGGFP